MKEYVIMTIKNGNKWVLRNGDGTVKIFKDEKEAESVMLKLVEDYDRVYIICDENA